MVEQVGISSWLIGRRWGVDVRRMNGVVLDRAKGWAFTKKAAGRQRDAAFQRMQDRYTR